MAITNEKIMISKLLIISGLLSMFLLLDLSCTSYSQDKHSKEDSSHNGDSLHMQNNPHNFNIAYLDKTDDSITITIMGRRRYMAHDLASALKDDFYIDSTKL